MATDLDIPSVNSIRASLESIDGVFREEPFPEDSPVGRNPAIEIERPSTKKINDPDPGGAYVEAPMEDRSNPESSTVESGIDDEPEVIFEVPPTLTDAEINNAIGEAGPAEVERLLQLRGIDALGWYVNFHQRQAQQGVYVPMEGVLILAARALTGLPVSAARKLELAFHAILRHEIFHFAAECMTANWELATGQAVYWPGKDALRNADGFVEVEEGLANAYLLRGFKHPTRLLASSGGASKALHEFCKKQPKGYDLGPGYAKSRRSYLDACRDLAAQYQRRSNPRWSVPDGFDSLLLYADPIRIDWTRCPIFITDRFDLQKLLGIRIEFFPSISYVEETDAFKKDLRKLDGAIREKWTKRRDALKRSTQLGAIKFRKWPPKGPNWWSVNVDGNFRAHLYYEPDGDHWYAMEIGDHKKLGHG